MVIFKPVTYSNFFFDIRAQSTICPHFVFYMSTICLMSDTRLCLNCRKHWVPKNYANKYPNEPKICRVCVRKEIEKIVCQDCENKVCPDCGGCQQACGWASALGEKCNCFFNREYFTKTECETERLKYKAEIFHYHLKELRAKFMNRTDEASL